MAESVAEMKNPQGAFVGGEPADRYAGRAMVHFKGTNPLAGDGHDQDTEASATENTSDARNQDTMTQWQRSNLTSERHMHRPSAAPMTMKRGDLPPRLEKGHHRLKPL